jgi:hypothetical protein
MAAANETMLPIPCPDCGELSHEPVERVAGNDVIPCSLCGGLIDLTAEECRPLVEQAKARLAGASAQPGQGRSA